MGTGKLHHAEAPAIHQDVGSPEGETACGRGIDGVSVITFSAFSLTLEPERSILLNDEPPDCRGLSGASHRLEASAATIAWPARLNIAWPQRR